MNLRRLTGAWLGPWGPRSQAAIFTGLTQDRHLHRADTCSGLSCAQGRHLSRTFIFAAQSLAQDLHLHKADTAGICTGPTQASICTGLTQGQHLHRAGICTGLAFAVGHYMHRAFICAGPSLVQGLHLYWAVICKDHLKATWRSRVCQFYKSP